MQVIFKNLLSLPDKLTAFFIETVDATGFVSVLYPIDSNHIRNWIWKNRIKRYRNLERMYICSIAAVGKQCSTLSVAADSGFSVWKRGDPIGAGIISGLISDIDAYRTWRLMCGNMYLSAGRVEYHILICNLYWEKLV